MRFLKDSGEEMGLFFFCWDSAGVLFAKHLIAIVGDSVIDPICEKAGKNPERNQKS